MLVHANYDDATAFASECAREVKELIHRMKFPLKEFFGNDSNKKELHKFLKERIAETHCFLDYGHGNETTIFGNNGEVLIDLESASLLKNKICYVIACSCGRKLGEEIVSNGGICFLGFSGIIYYAPDHADLFKECWNSGIKSMISDKNSAEEAYEVMRNTFYTKYRSLIFDNQRVNLQTAYCLRYTRSHVTLIGDEHAKLW